MPYMHHCEGCGLTRYRAADQPELDRCTDCGAPLGRGVPLDRLERHVLSARFATDSTAPSLARGAIHAALAQHGDPRADRAALLVSEIVTSSVNGSPGGMIEMEVSIGPSWLQVAISDGASGGNGRPALASNAIAGWGLVLIEAMADRWGDI